MYLPLKNTWKLLFFMLLVLQKQERKGKKRKEEKEEKRGDLRVKEKQRKRGNGKHWGSKF